MACRGTTQGTSQPGDVTFEELEHDLEDAINEGYRRIVSLSRLASSCCSRRGRCGASSAGTQARVLGRVTVP